MQGTGLYLGSCHGVDLCVGPCVLYPLLCFFFSLYVHKALQTETPQSFFFWLSLCLVSCFVQTNCMSFFSCLAFCLILGWSAFLYCNLSKPWHGSVTTTLPSPLLTSALFLCLSTPIVLSANEAASCSLQNQHWGLESTFLYFEITLFSNFFSKYQHLCCTCSSPYCLFILLLIQEKNSCNVKFYFCFILQSRPVPGFCLEAKILPVCI